MRTLATSLFLLLTLVADATELHGPRLSHWKPDGNVEELPLPFDGERVRVIVEFSTPPLARTPKGLLTQSSPRATLERFRRDLDSRIASQSTDRLRPSIEREYVNATAGAAVLLDPTSLDAVRKLPYVSRVSYDVPVRANIEPGVGAVRAPEVWSALGTRGGGVVIGIIDTGIDYSHPALGGGFGSGYKVIGGYDFVNQDEDPRDDADHGTHVAGIVAANSPELLGVAPDAKLVAYKVLDASGHGWMSDIVAAIDRSVDPNGDGDFSDHLDVVNMSLGGLGHPDDAPSRAVDAAVEAGVVFVIAAGNAGVPLSVGSPGTAMRAITVGAIDVETNEVAAFSSRGPAALQYTTKPDVAAPGVNVISAKRGGGLLAASGTSMAAPHVAGVAALLRALHPEWTAAQIKSAIVATANGNDYGVTDAGGGRVDAYRAAIAMTEIEPSAVSLGVTDGIAQSWSRQASVSITNHANAARTYTASTTGLRDGLSLVITPSEFALNAGETRELALQLDVDHTKLPFPESGTVSFGGLVTLQSGGEQVRVPWSFAKGSRVRVTYAGDEVPTVFIASEQWEAGRPLPPATPEIAETLVPPGRYDIAVLAIPTSMDGQSAVIFLPQQEVAGDRTVALHYDDAPFEVTFAGLDQSGAPITNDSTAIPHCMDMRLVGLPGRIGFLEFGTFGLSPGMRFNAMEENVAIYGGDLCADDSHTHLYAMEYEPLHGVNGSVHRLAGGNALLAQEVELWFPGTEPGQQYQIGWGLGTYRHGIVGGLGVGLSSGAERQPWRGTVYLSRQYEGEEIRYLPFLGGTSSIRGSGTSLVAQPFRVANGRVVSARASDEIEQTMRRNDPIVFGVGAWMPRMVLVPDPYAPESNVVIDVYLTGHLGERRTNGLDMSGALYDQAGNLMEYRAIPKELEQPVRYVAEGWTHEIDGIRSGTKLDVTLGGPAIDRLAPAMTSFSIEDAFGRPLLERITREAAFRIEFSVQDESLRNDRTTLHIRKHASGAWIPVSIDVKKQTALFGTTYTADLRLPENGAYDVRLSAEDSYGHTTTVESYPAFVIREGRMRSAQH